MIHKKFKEWVEEKQVESVDQRAIQKHVSISITQRNPEKNYFLLARKEPCNLLHLEPQTEIPHESHMNSNMTRVSALLYARDLPSIIPRGYHALPPLFQKPQTLANT